MSLDGIKTTLCCGGLCGAGYTGCCAPPRPPGWKERKVPMRIEPKTFFASERTYLAWLHTAVTLGSIGGALLGFSSPGGGSGVTKGIKVSDISCITGVVLVTLAVAMIAYAMRMFYWRAKMIREVSAQDAVRYRFNMYVLSGSAKPTRRSTAPRRPLQRSVRNICNGHAYGCGLGNYPRSFYRNKHFPHRIDINATYIYINYIYR